MWREESAARRAWRPGGEAQPGDCFRRRGSAAERWAASMPVRRALIRVGDAEHGRLVEGAPDDLKPDRQPLGGEAAGDGGGRMARCIEGPGEANQGRAHPLLLAADLHLTRV